MGNRYGKPNSYAQSSLISGSTNKEGVSSFGRPSFYSNPHGSGVFKDDNHNQVVEEDESNEDSTMHVAIDQAKDSPQVEVLENSPVHVKSKRVREPCSITDRSNQIKAADVIELQNDH